jgi:[acyl-carrier-protein] S-malonyltransferase
LLAVVVPGQGSQQPAMFNNWIEISENHQKLKVFSEISNLDLIYFGTKASKDEISKTDITQPLLTALSLISFANLNLDDKNSVIFAGHSVGEFSASAFSKFITEEQAMKLVTLRGKLMNDATKDSVPTGMAAILGGDKNVIIERLKDFQLYAANINSQGQIIASGKLSSINELISNPIEKTKVIKLDVSGAFHTPYMQNAKEKFETEMKNQKFQDAKLKLLSNFDGELISSGQDLKSKLTNQLTHSVRWDLCQESMIKSGVTGLLEVAPGGVLSGIAKKAMNLVEIMTIKTPEDIENANAFIIKHNR